MTVELLKTISLAAYIVAGILTVTAIVLYFVLDIKKILGEVSGSTERKAIENIRKQNADGSIYKPSHVNRSRGRVTDKMTVSGNLTSRTETEVPSVGTEKFVTSKLDPGAEQTTVLGVRSTEETSVLEQESTVFTLMVEMGFLGSMEIIE